MWRERAERCVKMLSVCAGVCFVRYTIMGELGCCRVCSVLPSGELSSGLCPQRGAVSKKARESAAQSSRDCKKPEEKPTQDYFRYVVLFCQSRCC